jgi:putative transposase
MFRNGLLLQRYIGKPPARAYDGQIITIRPNLRWTSGCFEIACWDGQSVRVAFALDTCDREVMSWVSTTGVISGGIIRDLMFESVERRYTDRVLPHPIERLSDNGSCYRTYETISLAKSIGVVQSLTPVRSPQSNGMAESFVKTFKRDISLLSRSPGCTIGMGATSAVVRGLQRKSSAQSPANEIILWSSPHFDRTVLS